MFWLRFDEKHDPTSGGDPCDRKPNPTFAEQVKIFKRFQ
jgi:hypothetical protein